MLPQEDGNAGISDDLQTDIIHNPTMSQVNETPITYQYYQTIDASLMNPNLITQTINIAVPTIHYQPQS